MLLGCVLSGLASSCLVRPFALGALLTGASLAVYKEGKARTTDCKPHTRAPYQTPSPPLPCLPPH